MKGKWVPYSGRCDPETSTTNLRFSWRYKKVTTISSSLTGKPRNVCKRCADIIEVYRTSLTDAVEGEHSILKDDPLLDWQAFYADNLSWLMIESWSSNETPPTTWLSSDRLYVAACSDWNGCGCWWRWCWLAPATSRSRIIPHWPTCQKSVIKLTLLHFWELPNMSRN